MTKIPINDLGRISDLKKERFLRATQSVIDSGIFLNHLHTFELERNISSLLGTKEAIAVGSGTAALEISFQALNLPRGSKVALVANAGAYGSIALFRAGLIPCYVDVCQEDALIDLVELERIVSEEKVSAVLVTHLYGNSVNMADLMEIISTRNLTLIEDCAQAIGGTSSGKPLGSFGDLSTFSFYPTKNLGAVGDAGAISGRNEELLVKVRSLAQYGWSKKYFVNLAGGTNSRIDELQAAYVNLGFSNLEEDNERRRKIALEYASAFSALPIQTITKSTKDDTAHLFVIKTSNETIRNSLKSHLTRNGVSCDIHYPIPDHKQIGFSQLITQQELAMSEELSCSILTLPLFPQIRTEETDEIISQVQAFYSEPN